MYLYYLSSAMQQSANCRHHVSRMSEYGGNFHFSRLLTNSL